MEKIILKSIDYKDLKQDIKKYPNYTADRISKSGKFYQVTLIKKINE
jgi:hypothetical protein